MRDIPPLIPPALWAIPPNYPACFWASRSSLGLVNGGILRWKAHRAVASSAPAAPRREHWLSRALARACPGRTPRRSACTVGGALPEVSRSGVPANGVPAYGMHAMAGVPLARGQVGVCTLCRGCPWRGAKWGYVRYGLHHGVAIYVIKHTGINIDVCGKKTLRFGGTARTF